MTSRDAAPTGPPTASPWVRAPQQERARRTFERIMEAGAALLAEVGYEGFSMSEVCRRAEVSPGALYDRVDGKDALFLAIHERELERITRKDEALFAESSRWRALSTPDLVYETVQELGRRLVQEQRLLKAFVLRAAADERVLAEGSRLARRSRLAVTSLLMTRAADYPHPDPESAVATAYQMVYDSLLARTTFGMDFAAPGDYTVESWTDRLSSVCRSYLMTPPPG